MNAPFSFDSSRTSLPAPFCTPNSQNAAVLITGGAQRIGSAIAQNLADSGWPVIIHYNSSDETAGELRDRIRKAGGEAKIIAADLSKKEPAAHLMNRASEMFGPIGVLINNASVFEWDDLHSLDEQSWARHMDLNLRTPLILSQKFVEQLPSHLGGVIVNMLDARVLNPTPRYTTYTLSKTGLWTLTRTLAQELAPRIRVNGIGPGPTLPPKGQTMEQFEERCQRLPLLRPGTLDEICRTVQFLISVNSITGQVIAVDGGDHLVGYCPPV